MMIGSKIKEYLGLIGSAVLLFLGIKWGSDLKEAQYNRQILKKIKERQKKVMEADREAARKKESIDRDNVADQLNKLC